MPTRCRQDGIAAVEMAILLIPLVLLTFGAAEFGRAIYQYNTLAKATRDAARYLSSVAPGSGYAQACLTLTGSGANAAGTCSDALLLPGQTSTTPARVIICDAANCAGTHRNVPAVGNGGAATGVMNLVTVTIQGYAFDALVPFVTPDIAFDAIHTTMRQAL